MRVCRALLLVCLVTTLTFAAVPDRVTHAIDASQTVSLGRSVHPKAQAQYDRGRIEPEFRFGYVTLLTSPSPSQQKAINRLLAEQQNPSSSNYHQWLTPEQYADRFGLSANDLNKITAWLTAHGFTVLSVPRGRNSIVISGTAAQFENAFQTEIHRYNVDGESHIANATPLKIPAALSGIVTVVRGLHDFHMKPYGIRRPQLHPDYFDSKVGTLLAPDDIAVIYDINPLYGGGFDGTGQKLAIVGQTDIYLDAINDFRNGFGLSAISGCTLNGSGVVTACNASNFQYVLVTGDTDPGTPSTCGDLGEADLDIEWSAAAARNAQIIFVTSPLTWDASCSVVTNGNGGVESALSQAIHDNVAPVISMSYGICELFASDDETELQQANLQGQTVVNSSGDAGAATCDGGPPNASQPFSPAVGGQAVSYPASSPEVTGVGGTHIPRKDLPPISSTYFGQTNGAHYGTANPGVLPFPEVAWNDDSEFALFCQGNASNLFCKQGGSPAVPGWVALGASATAGQVQEDIWISSGGGGPSNCNPDNGLSGNVCQAGFAQPAWQTVTVSGQSAVRFVPDVALMASPNFPGYLFCTALSEIGGNGSASTCAGGIPSAADMFSIVGGTSASAPIFAGMVTILNQYLGNASGMGNANPMLYNLAAVAPNGFNDVTSGNNIVTCKPGTPSNQPAAIQCPAAVKPATTSTIGYSAGVGYDLATGLGSVDLNNLAVAAKTPPDFSPGSSGGITAFAGQSGSSTITVTPINGFSQTVAFSCSGLASGDTCSFNPPTITLPATTTTQLTVQTVGGDNAGTTNITVIATTGVLSQTTRTALQSLTILEPDFTWAPNAGQGTPVVKAGQTATFAFTATPTAPATFADALSFTCSFSPSDSTLTNSCSVTAVPAGNGTTPVTVSIKTAGPNSGTVPALRHRADQRLRLLPFALPIAGVVTVGLARRKVSTRSKWVGLSTAVVLFGLLIACGGSGPPVSVSVTPGAANLFPNVAGANGWPPQTQAFTASVQNTSNTAVTWSVSAGGGSIDASGNYTAPATIPANPQVTVTATSQADSSKFATAAVNLQTPTALGTFTVTVTATQGQRVHQQQIQMTVQ